MAGDFREPDWSDQPERREWREPFFWLFVVVAVIVAALVLTNLRDDSTEATFATGSAPVSEDATDLPTPAPLPTAQPTPTPVEVPAIVEVAYAIDAITISGVVPAQGVIDALLAAGVELVGAPSVTADLTIDPDSSLAGGAVIISGEIDDEDERAAVLAAFSDLGLVVDDRLIIAGSDSSIADILAADPELSQISDFITAAGLMSGFTGESGEEFTLFAPTNTAVQTLDTIALDELSDATELTEVLQFHVVPGTITSRDLATVTALTTVQGESLTVELADDGGFVIGGAVVVQGDIDATNGTVHVVDAVLLPGTLRTEVALNQLVSLDPILFARGSDEILEESLPILDQAAQLLLENRRGRVEIQGHTDSDGSAEINLELSQRRADAVRNYLIELGVGPNRLVANGYGETALKVDPEESDEDKAENRRIEFRVG